MKGIATLHSCCGDQGMLIMRWFLLSLALVVGVAQSQEPTPAKREVSQKKQADAKEADKTAKPDERGTEGSPLVIKVLAPETTQPSATKDGGKSEHKSPSERFIELGSALVTAIATVVMAVFTVRLWFSTEKLWKTTNESIELARQDFISSHRPKLIVRRIAVNEVSGNGTDIPNTIEAEYVVSNIGNSPAKIVAVSTKLWIPTSIENLPATPPYAQSICQAEIIESGESRTFKHDGMQDLFKYQIESKMTATTNAGGGSASGPVMLFLGYIKYEDQLHRRRETAFLRQRDFTTKRFSAIKHPDYEYQD